MAVVIAVIDDDADNELGCCRPLMLSAGWAFLVFLKNPCHCQKQPPPQQPLLIPAWLALHKHNAPALDFHHRLHLRHPHHRRLQSLDWFVSYNYCYYRSRMMKSLRCADDDANDDPIVAAGVDVVADAEYDASFLRVVCDCDDVVVVVAAVAGGGDCSTFILKFPAEFKDFFLSQFSMSFKDQPKCHFVPQFILYLPIVPSNINVLFVGIAQEHKSHVVKPSLNTGSSTKKGGRGGGGTKRPFHRPFSLASNANDVVSSSLEDKDVDDKGRKFETTTDATWDIEVKPVELLISLVSSAVDGDIEKVVIAAAAAAEEEESGVCSLSSKEGNSMVFVYGQKDYGIEVVLKKSFFKEED
ncbi:hypothetical protein FF38_03367 [Lucilia cuprina]|uniref:Uncharacterized protein n=1 Tax=Lucilia cuprina TaxID=7375 RepID=A0A0L0C9D5_LUCCU|nr:hypothetical protein FF38_03367 [Lucilia cuprina]